MSNNEQLSIKDLSKTVLQGLYLEQHLTDTQIADLYNTYQSAISKLRRKCNIATILKSDRLDLPSLTSRQQSILIGSMLGDGRLHRTGGSTARFMEFHSKKQRGYLDWKSNEFGVFVSSVTKHDKKGIDGKKYEGVQIQTHASRVFYPYWALFYPKGEGSKTFGLLDPEVVDSLAVAIWYLDDGSKCGSYVRFSVGSDLKSQEVQKKIFQKFGFKVKIYGDGGDSALHITGGRGATSKFIDLIAPYVPACMSYKLDLELRKRGLPAREILSLEKLEPLIARNIPADRIAKILGTSRSSVGRAFRRYGLKTNSPGRPSSKFFSTVEADDKIRECSNLESVLEILLKVEFPIKDYSQEALLQDRESLKKSQTCIKDNSFLSVSTAGYKLCSHCFPYRFDAYYHRSPSLRMAWYDPLMLKNAIGYQKRVGHPLSVSRILRALQIVVHAPTNFRPSLAKAIVEAFCPENGIVLDPCAGYGGRAAGTFAINRNYIGVEPHPKAPFAYERLATLMEKKITLYNEAFEDVDLDSLRVDLVFTSPPYFSVERYSNDIKQSWVRYLTWASWLEGFLSPFVVKSERCLKSGGYFIVNTKNIKVRNAVYPIADEVLRLAKESDLDHQSTIALPLSNAKEGRIIEPLLVFRKR